MFVYHCCKGLKFWVINLWSHTESIRIHIKIFVILSTSIIFSYSYYPSYTAGPAGYHHPPPYHHKNLSRYARSHSKYRHPSNIHRHVWTIIKNIYMLLIMFNITRYCRMGVGLTPYMSRFNGLNYLSHPYLGSNTTSYTDWSREHTPGQ